MTTTTTPTTNNTEMELRLNAIEAITPYLNTDKIKDFLRDFDDLSQNNFWTRLAQYCYDSSYQVRSNYGPVGKLPHEFAVYTELRTEYYSIVKNRRIIVESN